MYSRRDNCLAGTGYEKQNMLKHFISTSRIKSQTPIPFRLPSEFVFIPSSRRSAAAVIHNLRFNSLSPQSDNLLLRRMKSQNPVLNASSRNLNTVNLQLHSFLRGIRVILRSSGAHSAEHLGVLIFGVEGGEREGFDRAGEVIGFGY